MKSILLLAHLLLLLSCGEETNSNSSAVSHAKNIQDTVIGKQENELNNSYGVGFLSKSVAYYWLTGGDTLDFQLTATEYQQDSTLQLRLMHKQPILFSTALKRVNDCLKIIGEDFKLSNLSSLYLKPPIYYADLSKSLSKQYEQKFGQKIVPYQKLNSFLLETDFNKQLNTFLQPLQKSVNRYGLEKFHFLRKENYSYYLGETDVSSYPDFTLHGMGISIRLAPIP